MEVPEDEVDRLAICLRDAYGEYLGDKDLVPWKKCNTREEWRVVARTTLRVLRKP